MEHLQLAYDVLVIFIGLAALAIAGYWALKTRESYLRNFSILYALFTLVLILSMLVKYLSLNLDSYSGPAGFVLIGLRQIASFGVIVAAIHFFHDLYQVKAGKILITVILIFLAVCGVLIFTPLGVTFEPGGQALIIGPAVRLGSAGYLLAFTYLMCMGVALIGRVWRTDKRAFVLGLLIFAGVGWLETLVSFPSSTQETRLELSAGGHFLFSSIPYALYGIFVIYYFLNIFSPQTLPGAEIGAEFLARYGITGREAEIIRRIVQGKSNAAIAGELFISLATVKTHLHNIYQKVGVESRFDLLARIQSGK